MLDPSALAARLDNVRDRIARAARRAGRDPSSIRLVAISKTFPAEYVRAAATAGQRDFGENKVQEALAKMDALRDLPVAWHLVGHLQSNKARKAGSRFDFVHSVDGAGLLRRLDEGAREAGRRIQLLVQIDLAGEPTKHGAPQEELAGILAAADGLSAARIVGLMLLPPAVDAPEEARPYFRTLIRLRDGLIQQGLAPSMLQEVSMGMSHDFEVAIEEGATMVRVGSAIFGPRPQP